MASNLGVITRPESLARVAYQRIRQAILDRRILADTLYSEQQIAANLGISRTPVREALLELVREGIVEMLPHRGFRVRTITTEDERELFDLRELIEAYVVRRLAKSASPGDVETLRAIVERQATATDIAAFLELDEEFHLTMPALLGLKRTSRILSDLRGLIFLGGSAALGSPERMREVIAEHTRIIEALASNNPRAAAAALSAHIEQTSTRALERQWVGSQVASHKEKQRANGTG